MTSPSPPCSYPSVVTMVYEVLYIEPATSLLLSLWRIFFGPRLYTDFLLRGVGADSSGILLVC